MNACIAAIAATVSLLSSAIRGQDVTNRIFAAVPVTAQSAAGTQNQQATQPAGLLPIAGFVDASIGGGLPFLASAQISWDSSDLATESTAVLRESVFVDPSVAGAALAGPNEFVVELTAPAAVPIVLEATRSTIASVGAPWPLVAIDVGNDGSIDVPNVWANAPVLLPAGSVGPAPLQVRVLFTSFVQGPGNSFTTVAIRARPDNALNVVRNALGCGPMVMNEPAAVFAGRGVAIGGDPGFLVVGLSTQPLLLQQAPFPAQIPWPCLLLPAPDIVVLAPSGVNIPLPASLRPVQFHVQMVFVSQNHGLWTSDGYTVSAL